MNNKQNIVILWRAYLEYQGKTLREGCEEIMQATGFIVDHSHANAWIKLDKHGKTKRNRPTDIRRFMMDETQDYRYKEVGIFSKKLKAKLYLLEVMTSFPGEIK